MRSNLNFILINLNYIKIIVSMGQNIFNDTVILEGVTEKAVWGLDTAIISQHQCLHVLECLPAFLLEQH